VDQEDPVVNVVSKVHLDLEATMGHRDHLVNLEVLDQQDHQEKWVYVGQVVNVDNLDLQGQEEKLVHRVELDLEDLLDHKDHEENQDSRASRDDLVIEVNLVQWVDLGRQEMLDPLGLKDHLDPVESLVLQADKAIRVPPDNQDHQENLDHLDLLDQEDDLEPWEPLESEAHLARPAHLDPVVALVQPGLLVQEELLEALGHQDLVDLVDQEDLRDHQDPLGRLVVLEDPVETAEQELLVQLGHLVLEAELVLLEPLVSVVRLV
jgi:hypothetical protein